MSDIPDTQPSNGLKGIWHIGLDGEYRVKLVYHDIIIGMMRVDKVLWQRRYDWFKNGVHWIEEKKSAGT